MMAAIDKRTVPSFCNTLTPLRYIIHFDYNLIIEDLVDLILA